MLKSYSFFTTESQFFHTRQLLDSSPERNSLAYPSCFRDISIIWYITVLPWFSVNSVGFSSSIQNDFKLLVTAVGCHFWYPKESYTDIVCRCYTVFFLENPERVKIDRWTHILRTCFGLSWNWPHPDVYSLSLDSFLSHLSQLCEDMCGRIIWLPGAWGQIPISRNLVHCSKTVSHVTVTCQILLFSVFNCKRSIFSKSFLFILITYTTIHPTQSFNPKASIIPWLHFLTQNPWWLFSRIKHIVGSWYIFPFGVS